MDFTTQDRHDELTSFQGEIRTRFETLVRVFGDPKEGDDDTVSAQWSLKFADGVIATIYSYDNDGRYHDPITTTKWNVDGGGGDEEETALKYVRRAIGRSNG